MVEQKMQAVKEYLEWRELPKDLVIRIRRYYEHYYTKRAIFNETEILSDLSPELKSEAVQQILSGLMGKLPLFNKLSLDFKRALFPLLTPMPLAEDETIYRKGEASTDIYFLITGSVSAMRNGMKRREFRSVNGLTEADTLDPGTGDLILSKPFAGCFGQTALLGRRRQDTLVASVKSEVLSVSKGHLESLFEQDPISARRLCKVVLDEFKRDDQVENATMRLRIATLHGNTSFGRREKAALQLQFRWKLYGDRLSAEHDPLYSLILQQKESRAMRWQSRYFADTQRAQSVRRAEFTGTRQSTVRDPARRTSTTGAASDDLDVQAGLPQVVKLLKELSARVKHIEDHIAPSSIQGIAKSVGWRKR